MESQKVKLTGTETRIMVTGGGWGEKWGDLGERLQTSSYKVNEFWGSNVQNGDYS